MRGFCFFGFHLYLETGSIERYLEVEVIYYYRLE
jgi:hypothetical protein